MFPQLGDTPEVAANKLDLVRRQLVMKQKSDVEALANSGYDTTGVSKRINAPNLPKTLIEKTGMGDSTSAYANDMGPKAGAVEDGHVFLGGDPRDPKNWREAPDAR